MKFNCRIVVQDPCAHTRCTHSCCSKVKAMQLHTQLHLSFPFEEPARVQSSGGSVDYVSLTAASLPSRCVIITGLIGFVMVSQIPSPSARQASLAFCWNSAIECRCRKGMLYAQRYVHCVSCTLCFLYIVFLWLEKVVIC